MQYPTNPRDFPQYHEIDDAIERFNAATPGSEDEAVCITNLVRALIVLNEAAVIDGIADERPELDDTAAVNATFTRMTFTRGGFVDALARHLITVEDEDGDPDERQRQVIEWAREVIAAVNASAS